ncbi:hypothetical protein BH23BAC4_BH23BAC4_02910 [soil metagenome]
MTTTGGSGDGAGTEPMVNPAPHVRNDTRRSLLLWSAVRIRRYLRVVLLVSFAAAVLTAGLTLLIPNEYRAETRVLRPANSGMGMPGLLSSVMPGAAALLGRSGGDYGRYLAILTSRTVLSQTVEEFNLVEVYDTHDARDPTEAALRKLHRQFSFEVSLDFDYLTIRVNDRDPRRAADMANFLVGQLNAHNIVLSSANARETRVFVENRIERATMALDSLQGEMQAFQEMHGVIDISQQGQAALTALAGLSAEVARLEVQYTTLRNQYGDENPEVIAMRGAVAAGRAQMRGMETGASSLMPVPMQRVPAVSRRYAELFRDLTIQATVVEALYPFYEQTRFDEERNASAVQVVDPATVPTRKHSPRRSLIVLSVFLSTLLLVVGFVLARAWLFEQREWLAGQLQAVR